MREPERFLHVDPAIPFGLWATLITVMGFVAYGPVVSLLIGLTAVGGFIYGWSA